MATLAAALLLGVLHWLPARTAAEPVGAAVDRPAATEADRGRPSLFGDFSLRSKREPISVRANKLEFSYRERVLTYSGQVVVTQGDLTLRADELTVTIDEDARDRLQQIAARGGVEITQGRRSASGGKAVFDQRQRRIELTESPVLKEGPNQISGDRVIVYLDEERSVVEGGDGRVEALLYPGEDLGALRRSGESSER